MITLLAIDPGGVHCGLALFKDERCVAATEYGPDILPGIVLRHFAWRVSELIVEEFRLYSNPALFSEALRTIEVIGVLRYLASRQGVSFVTQSASIKHVATAIARRKGISLISRGAGPHARDAELHGIYRIHTQKGAT